MKSYYVLKVYLQNSQTSKPYRVFLVYKTT